MTTQKDYREHLEIVFELYDQFKDAEKEFYAAKQRYLVMARKGGEMLLQIETEKINNPDNLPKAKYK